MTRQRMSVAQIKKRLELQMELDKTVLEQTVLEQQANALHSLESIAAITQARARISFCKELLREIKMK